MYNISARMIGDIAPGLTLAIVSIVSAIPAFLILSRSRRGRARSAVGYLAGFIGGIATTTIIVRLVGAYVMDIWSIIAWGLLSSFFAPFVGMARALWVRPVQGKRRHPQAL
jgi:hypothetical protein